VAHSMATITVQAGSALHVLGAADPAVKPFIPNDPASSSPATSSGPGPDADILRAALTAIRDTGKGALMEMRSVLGQLRRSDHEGAGTGQGLDGLDALRDAVTAAGARVTVDVEGAPAPLPAEADHSAYRILQESLTNVLRHAGPRAAAHVCLRYQPDCLIITVTDDGGVNAGSGSMARGSGGGTADDGSMARGNGISGMRERAASVGGELIAGPLPGGGFRVQATLPSAVRAAVRAAGDASAHGAAGAPASLRESS
jgi:signal transduction histidine kinase